MNLEDKIIESLLFSEDYARRVVPHVRSEYFEDHGHQVVVEEITRYFNEYSRPITKDILEIEVMKRKDLKML
jgi:replicative DNA helicase